MSTCGDFGGTTASGEPCQRPSSDGPCPQHQPDTDSPFAHIRHPKKRAFLRALIESGGNVTRATQLADINHSTPYTAQWREDEEFQAAWEEARDMAADHLEAEAVRRAYEGVSEPVGFYRGEPSATVQRYSDTLLIFLLKGARPEKYVERHQHTGADGGPIDFTLDLGDGGEE